MGLPFALIRPLVALVTSLLGGCLVNKLDDKESPEVQQGASSVAEDVAQKSFVQRMKSAFRYAFVEMMQDIGRWLLLGLVVAGLITVFVPDSFFALFADKPLLSMLLVLAFAVPMYLCATGSIPIAVALILKGLSPGTALVLLMAGPAVNVASMLVISKVMGKKTLALYLLSIVSYFTCFYIMEQLHIPYFMRSIVAAALIVQIVCAIPCTRIKVNIIGLTVKLGLNIAGYAAQISEFGTGYGRNRQLLIRS
jgi:uncharacterized membrane protein YraQ (UPF0718 family)